MRLIEELTQGGVPDQKKSTTDIRVVIGGLLLSLLLFAPKTSQAVDLSAFSLWKTLQTDGSLDIEELSRALPVVVSPKSRQKASDKPNDNSQISSNPQSVLFVAPSTRKKTSGIQKTPNVVPSRIIQSLIEVQSGIGGIDHKKANAIMRLCFKYYDDIDTIAKKHDFPTILILALWGKENSCKMVNENPDGIFSLQSQSKKYPVGAIDRNGLREQVEDLIKFCRSKIKYIKSNNGVTIKVSYDHFSLSDLKMIAHAYSGFANGKDPDRSRYVSAPPTRTSPTSFVSFLGTAAEKAKTVAEKPY